MIRLFLLAGVALAAPLAAQDTLGNYTLPPQTPAPSSTPTPPPAAPVVIPLPTLTPVPTPTATPTPRASETPRARATPRTTSSPAPRATPSSTPSPTPTASQTATPAPLPPPTAAIAPTPSPTATTADPPAAESPGTPIWLIPGALLALVAIGGGIAAWRRRVRAQETETGYIDDVSTVVAEPVEPEQAATFATSAPSFLAPTPSAAPGERAWLDVSLRPLRAGVNLATATADVEVTVTNRGAAPATNVRVGAALLSARSNQDDELGRLFAQPVARPAIAPFTLPAGEGATVKLLATLPRDAINVLDAGGRPMFVPIVAVNVLYQVGEGAIGQTASAYAVGIVRPGADKLGPFWLDGAFRMHDALGARPHALSLQS